MDNVHIYFKNANKIKIGFQVNLGFIQDYLHGKNTLYFFVLNDISLYALKNSIHYKEH